MLTKLNKLGIGIKIVMLRGQDTMTEMLPRVSLRSKISQDLRREFPTKFLPMYQGKTKIGYLIQSHKEEQFVVFKVICQIVPSAARRM